MLNLGFFTSLKDQEALDLMYGILGAIDSGFLSGIGVKYVFCDRPENIEGTLRTELLARNIRLFEKSSRELRKFISQNRGNEPALGQVRGEFDRGALEVVGGCEVDFVLLAGYMLITSSFLCNKLKMLNLHPDLPGRFAGTWQDIMRKIAMRNLNSAGAMIHLVTPELDEGPALSYFTFSVAEPDPEKIRCEEFRRELPLILLTLKAMAEGEITIREGVVYIHGEKGMSDFSKEVESFKL